jgi:hypothetical protein
MVTKLKTTLVCDPCGDTHGVVSRRFSLLGQVRFVDLCPAGVTDFTTLRRRAYSEFVSTLGPYRGSEPTNPTSQIGGRQARMRWCAVCGERNNLIRRYYRDIDQRRRVDLCPTHNQRFTPRLSAARTTLLKSLGGFAGRPSTLSVRRQGRLHERRDVLKPTA